MLRYGYLSYRRLAVIANDSGSHLLNLENHTDAQRSGGGGWLEESVDLSRFGGRPVKLTFYVDDVVALE